MLTKDLLRVSRAGGGYHPQFVDDTARPLAARVFGVFQGHVGERRATLEESLSALERDRDYKLVRGFAALLERDATFETRSPLPPERARRAAFEAAERVGGVASGEERAAALASAADRLAVDTDDVEAALYADRERNQVLASFDPRWDPEALLDQYDLSLAQTEKWDHSDDVEASPDNLIKRYNLSLAQTALFDATEIRVRCSDPRKLVTAIKRLRLMYEIRTDEDGDWEAVVTGPDSLFRKTRRYGTTFARLLRTVAAMAEWELTATIDDRGTERTMTLSDEDPIEVLGPDSVAEMSFDSSVEADFAARFNSVDLDWELVREPEPLTVGASVMIPDFAFDYKFADFRVFFEIMGFWTPEYVEKKLGQLDLVDDVEMLVAVDESLGVSEDIEARDQRAIPYSGSVRLKDVRDELRRYEEQLTMASISDLPDELRPEADAISLEEVAAEHAVSEDALNGVAFPEHERVGRTLVRPHVLDDIGTELESGMSLGEAEDALASRGISETSSVLSALGYRVVWEGLSGGKLREKE